MQGEERHFDGESEEEGQEQQRFFGVVEGEFAALQHQQNRRIVEGAGFAVEVENRREHQHGAGHGVEEELDGGVDAAFVAPDADEEVHRDEADFPEGVEEEEIE